MKDEHYTAFGAIERAMANTMSFMDFSSSRFSSYVRDITGETISVSASCRMLDLYEEYYRKRKNRDGMIFCTMKKQALLRAYDRPGVQKLFPQVDFSLPLQPEFVHTGKQRYLKLTGRMEILWMLSVTLVLTFLLAFLVLGMHLDFWLVWIPAVLIWMGLLAFGHTVLIPFRAQRRILEKIKYLQQDHRAFETASGMQKVRLKDLIHIPDFFRFQSGRNKKGRKKKTKNRKEH